MTNIYNIVNNTRTIIEGRDSLFVFEQGERMVRIVSSLFAATPEEILYGYGPLGVGVVALGVIGLRMFNIILKDRDKAIEDRDALLEDFFTKVIPAITRNTDVLERRQELDRVLIDGLKEGRNVVSENTKTLDEIRFILRDGRGNRIGGT